MVPEDRLVYGTDCRASTEGHSGAEFREKYFYYASHSDRPRNRQTVDVRAPDCRRRCTQRECLENVRATTDTPVNKDGNLACDCVDYSGECFERRQRCVEVACPVVG